MIRHVPLADLNNRHLVAIANNLLSQPKPVRQDTDDIIQALAEGQLQLYEFDFGIVLLGKRDDRLVLEGLYAENLLKIAEALAADLKRLAADWQCDTIETMVFDPRLASVIEKLGGRVESRVMILEVES